MKRIIAFVGPTASGKTGIGVRLARELNGEIISADSRQVYRGLDIGSGKEHFDDVKQWLIDIVEPGEKFSLFDWLELAREAVEDIFSRGKVPIIVGGTGLYVQALAEGFYLEYRSSKLDSRMNEEDRIKNDALTSKIYNLDSLSLEELNQIVKELDPAVWQRVDQQNLHRLKRAIERAEAGLKPVKIKPNFEVLQIAIDLPRQELYQKIDDRVESRFDEGMLEEIIGLVKNGVDIDWLQKLGLEYRIITKFIIDHSPSSGVISSHPEPTVGWIEGGEKSRHYRDDGILRSAQDDAPKRTVSHLKSLPEYQTMKQELKYKIHAFARRQLTWFRRFPETKWLSDYEAIIKSARVFLADD